MSCSELLVALGLALLVAGTLAPIAHRALTAAIALQAAGIALLGLGGALVLFGAPAFGASFRSSLHPALGIDGLTGFFLATLALVGAAALVYSRGYLAGVAHSRALIALGGLFLIALVGVVMARDPSSFLACWELMTLVPATAILVRRSDATVRHAVYVYLAVTHLGGAGVWICVLALAHYGALGQPGGARRPGRRGSGVHHRRRDRRVRDQGRPDAPALVAASRSSGRAEPHLRADVGGDDQGGPVRVDPRPLRVGRSSSVVGGPGGARAGAAVGAGRRPLRAGAARPQAAARLLTRSRTSGSSRSASAPRSSSRLRAMRPGRRSPSPRLSSTSSITRCSRRCCSSPPAPSSARSAPSTSTTSAACCGACPGRAGPSWSGRWRSPVCPRSTASPRSGSPCRRWSMSPSGPALGLGLAGALAAAGLAATAALAVFCFVKVVGLVLLGAAAPGGGRGGGRGAAGMRAAPVVPGRLLRRPRRRPRPADPVADGAGPAAAEPGSRAGPLHPRHRLAALAVAPARAPRADRAWLWRLRGSRRERPGPRLGLRPADRARARLELGGLHQATAAGPRGGPAAPAGDRRGARARSAPVRPLPRRDPAPLRHAALRAGATRRPGERPDRPPPAVRQRPCLRRLSARAAPGPARRWCASGRSGERARRQRSRWSAGSPWRRCFQGRSRRSRRACRGVAAPLRCSPTASCAGYGERRSSTLSRPPSSTGWRRASSPPRRSWRCSWCRSPGSRPAGRSATTRWSSSASSRSARFALAAASWDTGSGFALMGSSRDLTLSVFAEALLVLALDPRRAARRQHRPRWR